jgi:hypothetical protein
MWDLQEGLSSAGCRGVRAEGRQNRHLHVHVVHAVR